jgi:hypothetical protein
VLWWWVLGDRDQLDVGENIENKSHSSPDVFVGFINTFKIEILRKNRGKKLATSRLLKKAHLEH